MLNKKWIVSAGLAWASVASSLVMADQAHVTLGANLGYYRFDHEDFPGSHSDFDDKRGSWKAHIGFQANEVVGIEVGYANFGKAKDSGDQFKSDGISAALTAAIPFSPNFALYGKLGQLFWEHESQGPSLASASRDGNDMFYGLGTRMALASHLDLRLEYERFAIDRADVDMASIGLSFNF